MCHYSESKRTDGISSKQHEYQNGSNGSDSKPNANQGQGRNYGKSIFSKPSVEENIEDDNEIQNQSTFVNQIIDIRNDISTIKYAFTYSI